MIILQVPNTESCRTATSLILYVGQLLIQYIVVLALGGNIVQGKEIALENNFQHVIEELKEQIIWPQIKNCSNCQMLQS